MKFAIHLLPGYPATLEERERLRPIAHRTDKTQQMLDEMLELTQLAEEVGFDVVTFSEHHFYTEGCEAGSTPTPHLVRLLLNTKRISIGPLGFVLPTWDPIRLALDVAWADQMSRGRVVVGLARGVFPRWVNVLGQHYLIQPGLMGADADRHNREVFEELFEVLKLSWGEEPFSFNGRFYKAPVPVEGHEWGPWETTARMGAPGELDEQHHLRRISPVPKPYQKPRPRIFQAFTASEQTIRWTAREGIIPIISRPFPDATVQAVNAYAEEANKAGRPLKRGDNVGVVSFIYMGRTREEAMELARNGVFFVFNRFHATINPLMPRSPESFMEKGMAVAGTVDDVRRRIADIQEKTNAEYFLWLSDQGFLPIDVMRRQIELFGSKIIPEFRDRPQPSAAQSPA